MTKPERIKLIAACAKLEAVAANLSQAYELMDEQTGQRVFEQISSLHNVIGEILKIGGRVL